jgi:hypothetical protein
MFCVPGAKVFLKENLSSEWLIIKCKCWNVDYLEITGFRTGILRGEFENFNVWLNAMPISSCLISETSYWLFSAVH